MGCDEGQMFDFLSKKKKLEKKYYRLHTVYSV